jgi:hypothetical protein
MPGKLIKKILKKLKKKPKNKKIVIDNKYRKEYVQKIIDLRNARNTRNYLKDIKVDEMGNKHKDIYEQAMKSLNKKVNFKRDGGAVGPNKVL